MRAIIFPKAGEFSIGEIDTPEINDDEVLVRNQYAGFCGTDMHIYKGEFIENFPLIPGHEFSGIVEMIGKSVSNFNKGDFVAIDPALECGSCYYCQRNEQNFCISYGGYGVTKNGGFAEYSAIREKNLYHIGDIDLKEAALLEPLSCVINGLKEMTVNYGDKVLIFGAGPIGLILLQLLAIRGASEIIMVDIDAEKVKNGKIFGAKEVLINDSKLDEKLAAISPVGFDILVDATGKPEVCESLFKYANNRARLLFYGVCPKDSKINISPFDIYKKDLKISGAFSLNRTMAAAIELLKNKKLNLAGLISHEFELKDFSKAFDLVLSGKFQKIIFKCF